MSGAVQALIGSLAGVVKDAFWSSVSLLLPGNGTNGAQNNTFLDSSSNNFTLTRNGNVTQGTFSPFTAAAPYSAASKGGSGFFSGATSSTGLFLPSSSAFQFGTGDFCVEAWVYPTSYAANLNFFNTCDDIGGSGGVTIFLDTSGNPVVFSFNSNTAVLTGSGITAPLNTWSHVAASRSGTTLRVFVNGTQVGSTTSTENFLGNSAGGGIGAFAVNPVNPMVGYLSSLRVVKGSAVYTGGFTPSTTPLTAITNTVLLVQFTNAGVIDNAMLNDLETVGNAQISTAQSKFGGASMYFDGTGDYLVSNSDANNYAFGSGDFTIECWLYLSSTSGQQTIYDSRPASTQGIYASIYCDAGVIKLFVNSADRITGSTLSATTWYHIALSRSGTSTKLFVDGTQVGATYTDSNSYLNPAQRPVIGSSGYTLNTNTLNGYIDDLRITKGVARYTANFTPPAAAFPTS